MLLDNENRKMKNYVFCLQIDYNLLIVMTVTFISRTDRFFIKKQTNKQTIQWVTDEKGPSNP